MDVRGGGGKKYKVASPSAMSSRRRAHPRVDDRPCISRSAFLSRVIHVLLCRMLVMWSVCGRVYHRSGSKAKRDLRLETMTEGDKTSQCRGALPLWDEQVIKHRQDHETSDGRKTFANAIGPFRLRRCTQRPFLTRARPLSICCGSQRVRFFFLSSKNVLPSPTQRISKSPSP